MDTPDYRYHSSPELIDSVLAKVGGLATVLTFCQMNHVEVYMDADLQMTCMINQKCWGADLDTLSALILGVVSYIEHHQPTNSNEKNTFD